MDTSKRQVQRFIVTVTTYVDEATEGDFTDGESIADQLFHDWADTGVVHSVVAHEMEALQA